MSLVATIIVTIFVRVLNLLIATVPAYYIWNLVTPGIFLMPEVGFFQMMGLIALTRCFIGEGIITLDTKG